MQSQKRELDTERSPQAVVYHRADCVDHPDPDRPHTVPPEHHWNRNVVVGGDPAEAIELFQTLEPEECAHCGGDIEADYRVFEWPPVPISGDAAFDMFRRSDGFVVLRMESLAYPEDHIDWMDLLGIENIEREDTWYAGMIGDAFVTRTKYGHEPIWDATEATPSDFGVLLRKLPSEPKPIWKTPLSAMLEDYQNGHSIEGEAATPK